MNAARRKAGRRAVAALAAGLLAWLVFEAWLAPRVSLAVLRLVNLCG